MATFLETSEIRPAVLFGYMVPLVGLNDLERVAIIARVAIIVKICFCSARLLHAYLCVS